ncbi:TetR/AcrR family transcriptional regulator [Leifsonia sp. PS1209]|uniref:TetR/AcrR family transcriptional regulator n=1 Tax=Leifsonia sp. PS1209 TaxID=2724914 RepID=UPI001442D99F|nr:TetR/AcrR family transcriptional regulator [Leifsonia sp. PS1209]QIZ98157.1 TetR/AcrR family transcriptional regulator [Leifsonia sp. PS1209]
MPKVIDHDQRRSDIIDVTWALIVKGGLEAATMREIASEAGFANGALKHYFPGKDEIIQGTYDRALGMMSEGVATAVGDATGLEALRAIVYASAPLTEEAIVAGRVLLSFWERAMSNDDLHQAYLSHLTSWRGGLRTYIEQGRAAGDIVTSTPDEQLVDEIVLINVGANVMSLIAPHLSTPALLEAQLDAFFERITTA